jgi:hypothetical protein
MSISAVKSARLSADPDQYVLSFEPGLSERFGSLRECVATGVYQRGLKRCAGDLDQAPGNLSVQLSEDTTRHLSVDSFERYIATSGDMTPLYYLCEKFLRRPDAKQHAALAQLPTVMAQMQALMKQAGMA